MSESVMVLYEDHLNLCRDDAYDELGIIDVDHACSQY